MRLFVTRPSPLLRYAAALLLTLAASALRWALQPLLGGSPYITFYLAVALASAYGGFGPGVFATVLGAVLGVAMAIGAPQPLQLDAFAEQVRLLLYLLSGVAISLIAALLERARQQLREEAERLRQTCEELRLTRDRLLESDRTKDRALAVLAHELRNPLGPLRHSLVLLQKAPGDPEVFARTLPVMQRQVEQMSRLVDDLLDVTRIHHDKLELERVRLDLRAVVARAVEDHRTLFAERGVALYDRLPADPVWVLADGARLAQVLGNLLHNSLKFTPAGGEVRVSVEANGRTRALLRVRDTGAGIEPPLLERIFEPFTQAAQVPGQPTGGLGLGLTLVKRLVELHGGRVRAQSAGAGQGAEFTIELPQDDSTPLEVLVVCRDPQAARHIQQVVTRAGHRASLCHSGSEAIETAWSLRPHVVLCDVRLPDIDGLEVARALRCEVAHRLTLLIAVADAGSAELRQQAIRAGFDEFVVRPVGAQRLAEVLGAARGDPADPH